MINKKALIDILQEWKEEAENEHVGLKESAAYQRVISLVRALNEYESNQTIKQRIESADIEERLNRIEKTALEALDKVEKLVESSNEKAKGDHIAGCEGCQCYTCVHDYYNKKTEKSCCEEHDKECFTSGCDCYEEEK